MICKTRIAERIRTYLPQQSHDTVRLSDGSGELAMRTTVAGAMTLARHGHIEAAVKQNGQLRNVTLLVSVRVANRILRECAAVSETPQGIITKPRTSAMHWAPQFHRSQGGRHGSRHAIHMPTQAAVAKVPGLDRNGQPLPEQRRCVVGA